MTLTYKTLGALGCRALGPCLISFKEKPLMGFIHQAALSMEFPRQDYWSGLPFPPPEYLPNPGIKPVSSVLQADSLPTEPSVKFQHYTTPLNIA